MKKVLKEKKNAKLDAIKSYLKRKSANAGKALPNYSREREYERNLKMVAIEGSSCCLTQSPSCSTRFKKPKRTPSTRSPRTCSKSSRTGKGR